MSWVHVGQFRFQAEFDSVDEAGVRLVDLESQLPAWLGPDVATGCCVGAFESDTDDVPAWLDGWEGMPCAVSNRRSPHRGLPPPGPGDRRWVSASGLVWPWYPACGATAPVGVDATWRALRRFAQLTSASTAARDRLRFTVAFWSAPSLDTTDPHVRVGQALNPLACAVAPSPLWPESVVADAVCLTVEVGRRRVRVSGQTSVVSTTSFQALDGRLAAAAQCLSAAGWKVYRPMPRFVAPRWSSIREREPELLQARAAFRAEARRAVLDSGVTSVSITAPTTVRELTDAVRARMPPELGAVSLDRALHGGTALVRRPLPDGSTLDVVLARNGSPHDWTPWRALVSLHSVELVATERVDHRSRVEFERVDRFAGRVVSLCRDLAARLDGLEPRRPWTRPPPGHTADWQAFGFAA